MAAQIAPVRPSKSWPTHRWTLLLAALGSLLIVQLELGRQLAAGEPVQATRAGNSSEPSNSTAPATPAPTGRNQSSADSKHADAGSLLVLAALASPLNNLSVLCNSRCKCARLEPTSSPNETSAAELVAFGDELALDQDEPGASGWPMSVPKRQSDRSSAPNQNNASHVQVGGQPEARQSQLVGVASMGALAPSGGARDDWTRRANSTSALKTLHDASLTLFPASQSHPSFADQDKPAGPHESHRLSTAPKHAATPPGGLAGLHAYLPGAYLRRLGLGQQPSTAQPALAAPPPPQNLGGPSGGSDFWELEQPIAARLVPLSQLDLSAKLRIRRDLPNSPAEVEASSSASVGPDTDQLDASDDSTEERWNESLQLVDQVSQMMGTLSSAQARVQALVLRNNEMQFELWAEVYALLALPLRHQLFQLDLSHNSLSKLGVTFTGYIERHLAVRQIAYWPFTSTNLANSSSTVSSSIGAKLPAQQRLRTRYSIANGGKLYNAVMQRHIAYLANSSNFAAGSSAHEQHINNATIHLANLIQQPMQLRALDLSHNKLKWLISDQFRSIKFIQTIRLDYNRIRYIHQHAFNGLGSLRYVNLNSNKLQVIYIEQFQTNFKLMSLILRSNYLSYLRGGTFASLSNLKNLDISQNKLTVLSNNAFLALNSLERLNLSSNQFINVPSGSLHPLTSVRQLDLSANMIAQLAPGTFFHLPVEEILLNDNNQLVAIERGAFWDLAHLRRLRLSSNPSWISLNSQAFVGTPKLEQIDIRNCSSLNSEARELVENITSSKVSSISSDTFNLALWTQNVTTLQPTSNLTRRAEIAIVRQQESIFGSVDSSQQSLGSTVGSDAQQYVKEILAAHSSKLRYCYYMGALAFLALALKLVYKLSSDQRYLDSRRRRRRVYGTNSPSSDASMSCSPHSPASFSLDSTNYDDDDDDDDDDVDQADYSAHEAYQDSVRPRSHSWSSREVRATGRKHYLRSSYESIPMHIINRRPQTWAESFADVIAQAADCQQLEPAESLGQSGLEESSSVIGVALAGDPGQPREACCLGGSPCNQASQAPTYCPDQGCPSNFQPAEQVSANQVDAVHQQFVAAGLDFGHASCAHFYQSLGSAVHLTDYY